MEFPEIYRVWVQRALQSLGGRGSIVQVARQIWRDHEPDLRAAGDRFYTWQYDFRWAATWLRGAGLMRGSDDSPTGLWELTEAGKRS